MSVERAGVPWRPDIVTESIPLEAGCCTAPTKPGLGIDIDEQEAAKYPFKPEVLMAYKHRDGSVVDW